MERICPRCGEPIPVSRRSDAKYCSSECLKKHHYDLNQEQYKARTRARYVPKERKQTTCVFCGTDFTATKAGNVYCSKACVKAAWQVRHNDEVAARNARTRRKRAEARTARITARALQREHRTCAMEGCQVSQSQDPHFHGGMCSLHYQRARRADQRVHDLGVRTCPQCGTDMSTARRNAKYCSNDCTRLSHRIKQAERIRARSNFAQNKRRAAKVANVGSTPFTLKEWETFLSKLGYLCTYCGDRADQLQMDHIVALARGGPHTLANVTAACAFCNSSKKDRVLLLEWAPKRLGGRPRYDRTQPRGYITNIHNPDHFRGPQGPLPHILELTADCTELRRAIDYTEKWLRQGVQES